MLWCQGAQSIGLSNHELKSALNAPYDHNARPSQTDRLTNIMAIARRFVLTNASRDKNGITEHIYGSFSEKNNVAAFFIEGLHTKKRHTEHTLEKLVQTQCALSLVQEWDRSVLCSYFSQLFAVFLVFQFSSHDAARLARSWET